MVTGLITGVNGQCGSYMADLLISKGYKVVGVSRRRSGGGDWRIRHLYNHPNFHLVYGDVTDSGSLQRIVKEHMPDEMYNFAAQSFVGLSWSEPFHTGYVTALGVTNCLEAIKLVHPGCKFFQASSSEMFGKVQETPQKETTPFYPRSPYGVAKLYGYWITKNYRESYGLHASNGIMFNNESRRRGLEFVTRKITDGVAQIKTGKSRQLTLGNLDPQRDWSHSADFMEAAWLMLQQDEPDDYVLSSQETHSIKEFLSLAFSRVGLDWQDYVVQDEKFFRPAEVDLLLGDSSKARSKLGWRPKFTFNQLVEEMVDADLERHKSSG